MSGEPKTVAKRRRLPRFTLRALIAVVAMLSIGLGVWTYRAREQREVVELIRASGGAVTYYFHSLIPPRTAYYFGEDLFYSPISARIKDVELVEVLPQLPRFEMVEIDCESLTDADIEPLSKLRRLRMLCIDSDRGNHGPSEIGDASLKWIGELPQLAYVRLDADRVTSQGILALAQSATLQGVELYCKEADIDAESLAALRNVKPLRALRIWRSSPAGWEQIAEWDPGQAFR